MFESIGVIGVGFVGTAIREGFKHAFRVETYDRNPDKSTRATIEELVANTDGPIFVSVPTPMRPDGSCDTSIVASVVKSINDAPNSSRRIVIIKSTVVPGTTAALASAFPSLCFAFNPEFLTEANFIDDFKNQKYIIVGTAFKDIFVTIENVYGVAFPGVDVYWMGLGESEMFKYVANCFLAMKVSFSNELYDLCQVHGWDHNEIVSMAKLDKRLGSTHWLVPGPDGKRGYSGACFPKDVQALLHLANLSGVKMRTLNGCWDTNLVVRPERDWLNLKGRAVQ